MPNFADCGISLRRFFVIMFVKPDGDRKNEKITAEMRQLSEAVINDDTEITASVASELIALLNDKNKKCRMFK